MGLCCLLRESFLLGVLLLELAEFGPKQMKMSLWDLIVKPQPHLSVDTCGHSNGGKDTANYIVPCNESQQIRQCEVSFLTKQWQERRGFLKDCVIMFFSPTGTRRRVGKSYLERGLKEIHVGTNPDITEYAVCSSILSKRLSER